MLPFRVPGDRNSLTPGQFFAMNRPAAAFTPTQRLFAGILERAWVDYCEVVFNHGVDLDPQQLFSEQDAADLRDFVFSDDYGADDSAFLSCRAICKGLGLELSEVRGRFYKISAPESFVSNLAKDAPRKQFKRHEREQARNRQVAVMTGTKVAGE